MNFSNENRIMDERSAAAVEKVNAWAPKLRELFIDWACGYAPELIEKFDQSRIAYETLLAGAEPRGRVGWCETCGDVAPLQGHQSIFGHEWDSGPVKRLV
jgi:hypothetical protein